jgi:hypothetical protein
MFPVNRFTRDLLGKIKVILSQAHPAQAAYTYRGRQILGLAEQSSNTDSIFIAADPAEVELAHEQVTLLKVLYGQISPELQASFPTLLLAEINESNSTVTVLTLLHIGHLNELIKLLSAKTPAGKAHLRYRIWNAIRMALTFESHRFTQDDLSKLDKTQKRDAKWASKAAITEAIVASPRSRR